MVDCSQVGWQIGARANDTVSVPLSQGGTRVSARGHSQQGAAAVTLTYIGE
jgi:hypothetical protein